MAASPNSLTAELVWAKYVNLSTHGKKSQPRALPEDTELFAGQLVPRSVRLVYGTDDTRSDDPGDLGLHHELLVQFGGQFSAICPKSY